MHHGSGCFGNLVMAIPGPEVVSVRCRCNDIYMGRTSATEVVRGFEPDHVQDEWISHGIALNQLLYDKFKGLWLSERQKAQKVSETISSVPSSSALATCE